MINFKLNKFLKILYLTINYIFLAVFLGTGITGFVLKKLGNDYLFSILYVITLIIFLVGIIFNIIVSYIDFQRRLKFVNTIKEFIRKKEYIEAREYINEITLTKKHSNTIIQNLLYFLGIIELYLDNIDDAKYYLLKVKTNRKEAINGYCSGITMFLLFFVAIYEKNITMQNEIKKVYEGEKDYLLKGSRFDPRLTNLFDIIDMFITNNIELGCERLKYCEFKNMPFIERIVN